MLILGHSERIKHKIIPEGWNMHELWVGSERFSVK